MPPDRSTGRGQAWDLDTDGCPYGCEELLVHPDGTLHLENIQRAVGGLGPESQALAPRAETMGIVRPSPPQKSKEYG